LAIFEITSNSFGIFYSNCQLDYGLCDFSFYIEICINGATSPLFNPTRGLRQGCPLSPYLFSLVGKGLSRSIQGARGLRNIQGIKVGGSECLTHFLFVDVVLIFTNGNVGEGGKY
jgi:hypothetical protein